MSSVDSLRARFARGEEQRRSANRAALTGAAFAFPKPNAVQSPSTPSTVRSPISGASAAATKSWQTTTMAKPPQPPVKPLSLSAASTRAVQAHKKSQENLLATRQKAATSRTSSPSQTAAAIAAANYKPQSVVSPSTRPARSIAPARPVATRHDDQESAHEDRLPEPGTVKDVKKWLQGLQSTSEDGHAPNNDGSRHPSGTSSSTYFMQQPPVTPRSVQRPESVKVSPPPVILSPRPLRTVSAAGSIDAIAQRDAAEEAAKDKPPVPRKRDRLRSTSLSRDPSEEQSPSIPVKKPSRPLPQHTGEDADASLQGTFVKPTAPPARRTRPRPDTSMVDGAQSSSQTIPTTSSETRPALPSRTHTDQTVISQTTPPPSLPARPSISTASASSTSLLPNRSQSPAPSLLTTHRPSLDVPNSRTMPYRRVSPSLSSSNLANAIVGASLASSRTASPTHPSTPVPNLPPRPAHASSKFSMPFSRASTFSDDHRAPTPAKPRAMRKTMREDDSSSDESVKGRKGRNKLLGKHPHAHHEGTKKRWRDSITEVERKRYEGVWAANRGLLLPRDTAYIDCVHGYVVRDLWARSRLPSWVLEEVWHLVNEDGTRGWLKRTEFVVGLWLIDQRLKGSKLPVTVSRSVWDSAKAGGGVKVPVYR